MFSKYVTRGKIPSEKGVIIHVNCETEKGIIIIKNNLRRKIQG